MTSLQRRRVLATGTVTLALGLSAGGRVRAQPALSIQGAGATFPAPLYAAWIAAFRQANPDLAFAYDAVGSGEGIRRLIAGSVDFAASDAAMTDEQIAKVPAGVRLIPATAGLVVLAYNLPEVTAPLKLAHDVYPAILSGEITSWADPRIAQANPGIDLPDRTIAVVARLDSSGTTFALTNNLSAVSEAWRLERGAAMRIDWPGSVMLMRGNEGVVGRIKVTDGSIGYVEYGFASRLGLPMAVLENRAGRFAEPTLENGARALAETLGEMPANLRMFVGDPAGEDSYPIVTYSWLLLLGSYPDAARADAMRKFVRWGLTDGQKLSTGLGYIALPEAVSARALAALEIAA